MNKAVSLALGLGLLLLALFVLQCRGKAADNKMQALEAKIARMHEELVPLRFKITARTSDSISAEFRFYNLAGEQVGKRALTVQGRELHVDMALLSLGTDSWLFFPYAVYSDVTAPSQGFSLTDAYREDGFPRLYEEKKLSSGYRSSLTALFQELLEGKAAGHGNALHDIQELSSFKIGTVYAVTCHPHTGGVEITRE